MKVNEFIDECTKQDKRAIFDIQMQINESGKHKNKNFVQRECWKEAVAIFAKDKNIDLDWSDFPDMSVKQYEVQNISF